MAAQDLNADRRLTVVVHGIEPKILQNVHYEINNTINQLQVEVARQLGDASRVHPEMSSRHEQERFGVDKGGYCVSG